MCALEQYRAVVQCAVAVWSARSARAGRAPARMLMTKAAQPNAYTVVQLATQCKRGMRAEAQYHSFLTWRRSAHKQTIAHLLRTNARTITLKNMRCTSSDV
jgi:hypothetical protein